MSSKQAQAKAQQGYVECGANCGNCKHFASEIVKGQYQGWNGMKTWTKETKVRCGIGGFKIKKSAVCGQHEHKA